MVDFLTDWLATISEIIPPFCVELVLKDGRHYFLHSIVSQAEESNSLVIRIWDLRALTENDVAALRQALNSVAVTERSRLADAGKIHPKLDWANLRVHLDTVWYCVEWHDRLWPEEIRPKIGFRHD